MNMEDQDQEVDKFAVWLPGNDVLGGMQSRSIEFLSE